jgi:hypothetical protein
MKKSIRLLAGVTILLVWGTFLFAQNSVLSTGNWYKIAVDVTGIYKITYNDLVSYGLDPGQINPKHLRLYGNGNGMLPELANVFHYDDLQENAIFVFGENDEVFDPGDYILFYGEGPTEWDLNESSGLFEHRVNLYSDFTYYFINADIGPGKRIEEQNSTIIPPTYISTSFNDYYYHELELENLIHSGKNWYGERFEDLVEYDFQIEFPNLLVSNVICIEVATLARSTIVSNMFVSLDNQDLLALQIPATNNTNPNADYAKSRKDTSYFYASNPIMNLKFQYDQPTDSSIAWLDYFALNAKCHLVFNSGQMSFRDTESVEPGKVTKFIMQVPNENITIWNVTDPLNPGKVNSNYLSGLLDFTIETDSLLKFIAFNGTQFFSPYFEDYIENQNLHGIEPVDLVIVSYESFVSAAQQLANFRESNDGISSVVVTSEKIYNEFSSGAQDIMAIRNFVKYMFQKSNGEKPKYLLLFGDASYDYKDRIENNTNFIPVWESIESLNPVVSFCSDDYFGYLNDDYLVDVGIGRLPVKSTQEAQDIVQKIINYSSAESAFGSWRNEICLIADDEDQNLHFVDTEKIAELIDTTNRSFNLLKIYLDAYEQITNEEGDFYPDVNEAITDKINKGVNIINYVGHGDYNVLAHEKIFTENDINNWNNIHFPFLSVATCDFGRFDDPEINSLAEQSLLLVNKGMIGISAPSRATYAGGNAAFYKNFFKFLLESPAMPLGQVYYLAKENTGSNDNTRKHILFGDPSMKLAIPKYNVITEAINGSGIVNPPDTVNPGEQVIVSGYLIDEEGNNAFNFNGNLQVKIFERAAKAYLIGNDPPSAIAEFITQDSVLLELETEVINGQFAFTFNLPYEMDEDYGTIKISYYAMDYLLDAAGHYSDLIVGGQPNAIVEQIAESDMISFYPTVVTDYLNFTILRDIQQLDIEVFDITGKKTNLYSWANKLKGEQNQIDLSGLDNGFYIIHAIADGRQFNQKIIKK